MSLSISIRWKLILSIGLPLVLTYLGMFAWDYATLRNEAIKTVQTRVSDRADDYADKIDMQLRSVMALADSAATFLGTRSEVSEFQIRPLLMNNIRLNPLVFATWIALTPAPSSSPVGAPTDERPLPDSAPRRPDAPVRQGGIGPPRPVRGTPTASHRTAWMLMHATNGAVRNGELEDDYSSAVWFAGPRESGKSGWFGPMQTPHFEQQQVCLYAAPFKENDLFKGVVVVALRVQDLQNLLHPPAPPKLLLRGNNVEPVPDTAPAQDAGSQARDTSDDPPYVLIDSSGRILSTPRGVPTEQVNVFELARQRDQPQVAEALRHAIAGRGRIARIENMPTMDPRNVTGRAEWIAFAPVSATGWVFATATPEAMLVDPILHRLAGRALFLLQGLGLMVAVVLFVSIRMVRPIERMAKAVDDLAAGKLDTRMEGVNNHDEIGRLARGFDAMLQQLNRHVEQLTAQSVVREKVESEMRIARQIQTDLLPRKFPPFPERNDFDLHGVNIPARSVAGDFFDYFLDDEDVLTVVVADVSGKGVPAAILMAVTRTIVRDLAMAGLDVGEIARRANDLLIRDSAPGMFVTMWLGQYKPATGELTYVNAGHPLPYRFGPSCPPQPLGKVTAPLLGVEREEVIGQITRDTVMLGVGESILLYTDGVTEARSPDDRMVKERGVQQMLTHYAPHDPPQVCLGILRTLEKFQASHRHDDVTLVVLRRNA